MELDAIQDLDSYDNLGVPNTALRFWAYQNTPPGFLRISHATGTCTNPVLAQISTEADVHALTDDGKKPLDIAMLSKQYYVATSLICQGTDIDLRDGTGMTTLHRAVARGDEKGVEFLLEKSSKTYRELKIDTTPHKDNVGLLSNKGWSCLYAACAVDT